MVLGVPRSGTSTLSRAMRVFGAEHGANLLGTHRSNPKGFWEDNEVLEIDDAVLAANASKWSQVGLVFNAAGDYRALQTRAKQVLQDAAARSERFAVKEPRMARLLDFWKPLFRETGWNCRYIIALRNPISVAASLAEFQVDAVQAALLWAEYLLSAIRSTTGEIRTIVDYDRLIADPQATLHAAGAALGGFEPDPSEMQDFLETFLESELRHNRHDLREVLASPEIPAPVAIFYSRLLRCSTGELSLDDPEIATSIASLEQLWRELSPVWQWLTRQEDKAQQLRAEIDARDDRITETNTTLIGRDIRIAEFIEAVAVRDQNLAQLRELLAARDSHIAGVTEWLARREAELATREQIISERDAWIATLTSSKSWKLTQPLRRLRARLSRSGYS